MPAKKREKTFGLFKLEESAERMVTLGNNIRLRLTEGTTKGKIASVGVINMLDGKESKMNASELVQAAIALQQIDRSKRFVCGFHGSYESNGQSRQLATCPNCHTAAVQVHTNAVRNGTVQLEEDDA